MTTIQFFQSRHSPDSSDMAPSIERQPIDYLQQNKTVNIIPKGVVGAIWDQKTGDKIFFDFFLEKIKKK